jgi:hypothetical protein
MQDQRFVVYYDLEARSASRARRVLTVARTLRECARELDDLGYRSVSDQLIREAAKVRAWPEEPVNNASSAERLQRITPQR